MNKNTVPFETKSPMVTSGIRVGHAGGDDAGHERGRRWPIIAGLIDRVLSNLGSSPVEATVRGEVQELTSRFPLYPDRVR